MDTQQVLPEFVIALPKKSASRRHFLAKAKHAIDQSSINQQDVESLPVINPPPAAQKQFEQMCRAAASISRQQADALNWARSTTQALLHGAFYEKQMTFKSPEVAVA